MKKFRKLFLILIIITLISLPTAINAGATNIAYGAATVSVPILNLRSSPSTDSTIVSTLSENDIIVILERTNSDWYYINSHGSVGYVNVPYLKDILVRENFNAMGKVTGDWVNMRSGPSTTDSSYGTYQKDTVMTVIGINNGWYKVKHEGYTGYMRSDCMEIIAGYRASSSPEANTSNNSSSTAAADSTSAPTVPTSDSALSEGQRIAQYALGFVGSRYVYGGASPSGFDCSGFTSYVYKQFGYSITRTASGQYRDNGVKVDKSELVPGDLIFTSSNGHSVTHVGIYIGDNEFVHASTSTTGVIISRLDSTNYVRTYFGAKRIVS